MRAPPMPLVNGSARNMSPSGISMYRPATKTNVMKWSWTFIRRAIGNAM